MMNLKPGEVDLGTSIMAVTYNGGVILGADSRTSTGRYVANRVSDKLTPITERIFCCRSGSAADTQAIADIVRIRMQAHELELARTPQVVTAATMFQNFCYEYKEKLMAGIICAGWDEENGGQVYSIPLGGALVKQPYAIAGSGSSYIYGYCDANWRPNMTKEECLQFVKTALAHAMSRDGSSGGVIRTVTITKDGWQKDFTPGNGLPFVGNFD
jgi:20S proteasome subunit beta 1